MNLMRRSATLNSSTCKLRSTRRKWFVFQSFRGRLMKELKRRATSKRTKTWAATGTNIMMDTIMTTFDMKNSMYMIYSMMKLPHWHQNYRLLHGHHYIGLLHYLSTMAWLTQSSSSWAIRLPYPRMVVTQQSWWSPSSWRSEVWPRPVTHHFGQGLSVHGRSSKKCFWLPSRVFSPSPSLRKPCFSAPRSQMTTFSHLSEGFSGFRLKLR